MQNARRAAEPLAMRSESTFIGAEGAAANDVAPSVLCLPSVLGLSSLHLDAGTPLLAPEYGWESTCPRAPRPKPHSRIRRFDAWSHVQRARGPGEQPPAPTEAPPSRRRTPRVSKTPKHRNSDREDGETRRRGVGAAPVSRAKRRCTRLPRRRGAQSPLRAPSALSAGKSTRSSLFPSRPRISPGPRPSADA